MRLGVNIDHVATIRQARQAQEPKPVTAAVLAELAGAEGITVHLRADHRHIQERDLQLLREMVSIKLNVEMAATQEMISIASLVKPDQVTLVPERKNELTTTGGLDVVRRADLLKKAMAKLHKAEVTVSLFIDADPAQVRKARAIGARRSRSTQVPTRTPTAQANQSCSITSRQPRASRKNFASRYWPAMVCLTSTSTRLRRSRRLSSLISVTVLCRALCS